jgi:tetratricopeptide (TPR) repeat protein
VSSLLALLALLALPADAAKPRWEPSPRSAEPYNIGADALNAGDTAAAEAAFRQALEQEPDCGMALLGLGMALLRQDRDAEAAEALAEAGALFPDRAEVLAQQSEAAFAAQDFERALALGQRAVELDPRSFAARVTTFNALLRAGDYGGAGDLLAHGRAYHGPAWVDCLEIQLRAEQGEVVGIDDLWASCQRASDAGLVQSARIVRARAVGDEAELAAAAQAMDEGGVATLAAVQAALRAGDLGRAAAGLDEVLRADPRQPDALLLRAELRLRAGDREGAREDLEAILEIDAWVDISARGAVTGVVRKSSELRLLEHRADAGALLARLALEDGDPGEAAERLEAARALGVTTPLLAVAEADLAFAEGREGEAWAGLAEAVARWPGDGDLARAVGKELLESEGALPRDLRSAVLGASDWTLPFNLAVRHHNAGEYADALEALDGLAERVDPADRSRVRALAYRSALALDDLTAADALVGQEGVTPTLHHVWLRYDAGRAGEALTLLRAVEDPGEDRRARAALLEVVLLCDLGRLDEALVAASGPHADAEARSWAAGALLEAGRSDEARALRGP